MRTKLKKLTSVCLAVIMLLSVLTVAPITVNAAVETDTYIVAGSEEVFGSNWGWTDENNLMTDEDGDGIYTLVIPDVEPFTNAQFKIVMNGTEWIGPMEDGTSSPESRYNFQFNIDETCDVTITFNPATYEVTYTGDYVSEYVFSIEKLRAVGNGGSGWLNDINWGVSADENLMEEIAPDVYQLVMVDVEGNSNAQLKFAADGSWGINWGAAEEGTVYGSDEVLPLTYNGQNICVVIGEGDYDENLYTVTLTVDLSHYNDKTKEGATVLIEQEVQTEEPTKTPEETTEAPTDVIEETTEATEAPTEVIEETTGETTDAPSGAPLTVNATSNFFSKAEAQYNAETNKVLVSYYLESDKDILHFKIGSAGVESTVLDGITYDPEVLKVSDDWTKSKTVPMCGLAGVTINLNGIEGSIKLNGSNLCLWNVNPEIPFIQVEFEVLDLTGKGPVTTTIGCEVDTMIVAELNADEEPVNEDYLIKDKIADEANLANNNVKATTTLSESTYVPAETSESTKAEPTTVEPAADDTTIKFRVPSEWREAGDILAVYCHIYHIYGDDSDFMHPAWKSKYAKVTYNDVTGIATFTDKNIYDAKGSLVHSQLEDGNDYGLLFVCKYKDTNIADKQTGNVLLSTECYGGTIYVTGNMTENIYDSSRLDAEAKWEDERLTAKYGPVLGITSTGNIINDYIPVNMPKAQPIAQFIGNYAKLNSEYVTPETVQGIMNDSRFRVTAQDVLDVYADIYAADLEAGTESVATLDEVKVLVGYIDEPTTTDTYIVAGSEEVFGFAWDGAAVANMMLDLDGDGVYTLTLANVQPITNAQFKVVKNGMEWIGPEIGNYSFNVVEACDVTITFNAETYEVSVSGDGVTEVSFAVESMRAVGNGYGGWLNDVDWNPAADENLMTEVSDGVYQLVMTDVEGNSDAEFRFAANGDWSDNWGGVFADFGVETEAVYNGDNIVLVIGEGDEDENLYTVTLTLDLSAFDYATKTGAKFTVSQRVQEDEPETTSAQTGAPLTVKATSNFFSKAEAEYNAETNKVLVSYYLESDKNILNFQIGKSRYGAIVYDGITYDPKVLKISDDWTNEKTVPLTGKSGVTVNLNGIEGSIKLNGSNTLLWESNPEIPFIQVEFDVLDLTGKGSVTTTIGCEVDTMVVAELNADEEVNLETIDYLVNNKIADEANIANNNVKATTTLSESTYVPAETSESTKAEPTTVEETTMVEETTEVEEPTTAVPTTAEPEEPTQPTDTYIVAGSGEVFGANWDGTAVENMMTDTDGDGVYTLTLKDVQPIDKAQFKIVKNGVEWIGPEIGNYEFNVIETCDVTISYNSYTGEVSVYGTGVTEVELIIYSVRAVGNGGAGWLNDVEWDPAADANLMTEISDGVYQIVMTDVEANMNAQVKFAANGSWSDNWGGVFIDFDVETEAEYNCVSQLYLVIGEGDDDENLYTVTLTLDLTAFDYATKTGAKFTVSQQVQGDEPVPTEPEIIGDVNGDGRVSINDVTAIQKYLVNLIDLTDEQLTLADVDKDGEVLISDATLIQKYLIGLAEI